MTTGNSIRLARFDEKHPLSIFYNGLADSEAIVTLGIDTRVEVLEYKLDRVSWDNLNFFFEACRSEDGDFAVRIDSGENYVELERRRTEEGQYLICEGKHSNVSFLRVYDYSPENSHDQAQLGRIDKGIGQIPN